MSPSDLYCSSCGTRNDSEAAFCRSCGARLAKPAPPAGQTVSPPPPPLVQATPFTPRAEPAPPRGKPLPLLVAVAAIAVLLLVVLVEAAVILLPRGSGSRGAATLSVVQGEVSIQKTGQRDWMTVTEDVLLEAGDRILTADGSQALLTFMKGTTTEVRESTELAIQELQVASGRPVVIRIRLDAGETWNRITQLPADSIHEVSTLAAAITCRGSAYGVVVDAMSTTWVRGHEGRVEVTGAGSTLAVAPGDTLMVELGSPPVSYDVVAVVPTAPTAEETREAGTSSIQGADLPTFLNQPLPTGTPTNTPPPTSTPRPVQPSPTATTRPQPTSTRSVDCPTITIREPSVAPAKGPFGIEFDRQPGRPGGYEWVVEFRQPDAQWNRAEPVPADVEKRGQFWMAELRAPGEGEWHWRICLVASNDLRGPSYCCSQHKVITHQVHEGGDGGCGDY